MAFALGNKPLPGYPMPLGDKIFHIFDHTGPASYTQFTTPATGGDVLKASSLSVGGFTEMKTAIDTTGQIAAYAVMNLAGYANAVPSVILVYYSLVTATIGGQSQTIGTQIAASTNLSAISWRLNAICV